MGENIRKPCAVCSPNCIKICPVTAKRKLLRHTIACPVCGGKMLLTDAACPHCGARLMSICPECGVENEPDAGRCAACGYQPPIILGGSSRYGNVYPDNEFGRYAPPPGNTGK